MIIIGEKINGCIPSVERAIQNKDVDVIRDLALRQTKYGANYIDICAGTSPEIERETLEWLINIVQDTVDTPLCIDSSDTQIILDVLPLANKPGMINSISEEHGKADFLLPKIADTEWKIVALTCDDTGISLDSDIKYNIAKIIIEKAKNLNIDLDRLYIDPLVTTISTSVDAMHSFNDTIAKIKSEYPEVHITSGLSNISFGMPYRKGINQQFLTLAMSAGMDSAIMDPISDDMRTAIYATDALLGKDRNCRKYLQAFRKGFVGPKKDK